jgi:hypothetical protein
VPVLNHEAVVGGLARAYDVRGDEAPDSQVIIINKLMDRVELVLIDAKRYMPQGWTHVAWG